MYIVGSPPPPRGGGNKIKGFREWGRKSKAEKKGKKIKEGKKFRMIKKGFRWYNDAFLGYTNIHPETPTLKSSYTETHIFSYSDLSQ